MAAATRKDPRPRNPNGDSKGVKLINKDPNKHYVFVNPADPDAVMHYESAGYTVEELTETGVRLAGMRTVSKGQDVTYRGQVLMSIPLETKKEHDAFGVDGDTGWAWAKQLEERIVDKTRMQKDLMRGFDSRYTRASAEIGSLHQE